jgi:large subunit ribosomal protein L24
MKTAKNHIRKDDKVRVIAGKEKGKIGKVLRVDRKKNRILIERINLVKRHTRPTDKNRQGGIVESEAPLHCSDVMLVCNKCMAPVRVQMKRLEDGKKIRTCRKCDELIDS